MKKENIISAVVGLAAGILLTGFIISQSAPGYMIVENKSKLGFEETVETIKTAAAEAGWKVPTVHHIDKSVAKAGYNVLPVAVIELCKPGLAGKILEGDKERVVSSMMPCRVAVYKKGNGDVIVSRMNTGMMSSMFGGKVAEIMADATKETEKIFLTVIEN